MRWRREKYAFENTSRFLSDSRVRDIDQLQLQFDKLSPLTVQFNLSDSLTMDLIKLDSNNDELIDLLNDLSPYDGMDESRESLFDSLGVEPK